MRHVGRGAGWLPGWYKVASLMRLASRMGRIGESATLRVSRKAGELKRQGVEVADFSAGEPDFGTPEVAVDAAIASLRAGFTRYTAAAGIPELREALAARYAGLGAPWQAGSVVVTVGAKAGLLELAMALFESGTEVILPTPYWVTFPEQVRLLGSDPVAVETSVEDGFRIHAEPILAAITDRTRAVILNSPCNPTGGILEAGDLERIVEACAEREIVVIADETYERFIYDGREHASAAALAARYPETIVLVGSFSKTYAMTGWRLGYLLGPAPVVGAVSKLQSHATSNVTSFAMPGALAALEQAEPDVRRMLDEYAVRRQLVADRLEAIPGVSCPPPSGAFYAFPRVSDCYAPGRQGSIEMAEYLLDEARVAVVPGLAFGNDDHIRISFACSREQLELGLDRLETALST